MILPVTGEALPVVPVAADAALATAALFTFMACIVCIGLREAWGHTIGWGLRWVAGKIRGVAISGPFGLGSFHPLAFLADALEIIDHNIAHALATAALNTEKATVYLWHMTAVVFWWSVHETKSLALDTWHALHHTVTVTVPDAAKWARREAIRRAETLVHREAAVRRAADHELRHLARVAEADAISAEHAAAHALDWSESQVGHIGREIEGIRARLRRLEHRFTQAAVVGLVIAALGTLGLGFLRCPNFKRMGKKYGCGLWSGLESLLVAAAAFGIAADFRDVVKAAVAVEGQAAHALGKLAALDEAAIQDAAQAVADAANAIAGA